jgi:uncharacterized protein (DUF342 family)
MPRLLIGISGSADEAFVQITGETLQGDVITVGEVRELLTEKGVVHGIDDEAIKQIVDMVGSGEGERKRIKVAVATPPDEGKPPKAEFKFPTGTLVHEGAVLIRLVGGREPKPGWTVRGHEIAPPKPQTPPLVPGDNVESEDDGREFRSLVHGYLAVRGSLVRVEPALTIAEDKMSVSLRLIQPGEGDPKVTEEALRKFLAGAGVAYGVKEERLKFALEKLQEAGAASAWIVVAEGTPPVDGKDARFELLVEAKWDVGRELEDGTVDFRQRRTLPWVTAGAKVARIIPPTSGTPGTDVSGKKLPCRPGRSSRFRAGKNVRVAEDKLTFMAEMDGVAYREGKNIRIVNVVEVPGDVDFSTGSLVLEKSGATIQGNVRSTFSIRGGGPIFVGRAVEDAVIETKSGVEVMGGIVHGSKGRIVAGADVKAGFAQNARILSGGTIQIRQNAHNCTLVAKDRILILKGKGVLVGGRAVAGRHIEVKVAGSQMGVKTVLQVGFDPQEMGKVEGGLKAAEEALENLRKKGGEKLEAFEEGDDPPADIPDFLDLWGEYLENLEKHEELTAKKKKLLEFGRGGEKNAVVVVHHTVYNAVDIMIGELRERIKKPVPGGPSSSTRTARRSSASPSGSAAHAPAQSRHTPYSTSSWSSTTCPRGTYLRRLRGQKLTPKQRLQSRQRKKWWCRFRRRSWRTRRPGSRTGLSQPSSRSAPRFR